MWLPTSVYKRIPQFWYVTGLLFIVNGLYLGLDIPVSSAYIAIGIGSCAFGAGIAYVRSKHRRDPQDHSDPSETQD